MDRGRIFRDGLPSSRVVFKVDGWCPKFEDRRARVSGGVIAAAIDNEAASEPSMENATGTLEGANAIAKTSVSANDRTNEFMQLLTGFQSRLYAYICSMVGDATGSFDVLQETNVVLWNKASEYDPDRPFTPWAFRIAYLQVLAYRKRSSRSRLVFDEALIAEMTEEFLSRDDDHAMLLEALDCCLEKLPGFRRELIDCRYARGETVEQIARRLRKAPNVVSASLYRVRKVLLSCIESRLAAE